MSEVVYTNYWVNRRDNVLKEHGSYTTEEEALDGIKAWWDLQRNNYRDVQVERTNTGALEVNYGFPNYYYRIERRVIDGGLPSRSYNLRSQGEIDAQRAKLDLPEEYRLFDELAETYRDRLILTMADAQKVRTYVYEDRGRIVRPIKN